MVASLLAFARAAVLALGLILVVASVGAGGLAAAPAGAPGPLPGWTVAGLPGLPASLVAAGPGKVMVSLREGQVRVISQGVLAPAPVLERPVRSGDHSGLLGLAWAGDAGPGRPESLWVALVCPLAPDPGDAACSGAADMLAVVRYRLAGEVAVDPVRVFATGITLTASGTTANLGGALALGPDGSLFVSVGDHCNPGVENCRRIRNAGSPDPGCAGDPGLSIPGNPLCNTPPQDLADVRGKVLRVDPWPAVPCGPGLCGTPLAGNPWAGDPDPARRLVWAFGLRNAYGLLVHPGSAPGAPVLFITDNGTSLWDEVNLVTLPGRNYGWPYMEGSQESPEGTGNPAPPAGVMDPAWQVDSAGITGVVVAPGPWPAAGRLLACQYVTGTIWDLVTDAPAFTTVTLRASYPGSDCRAGIATGPGGRTYWLGATGGFRLVQQVDLAGVPVVMRDWAGGW